MLNLGTGELLVILLVALLVLGPAKLPQAARQMGKAVAELRRMSAGFQAEMRDALQEPVESVAEEPLVEAPAPTDLNGPADGRDEERGPAST